MPPKPEATAPVKHISNGACPKCQAIALKYPGLEQTLWGWFKLFQAKYPVLHISEAGRGYEAQEKCFAEKKSRARYGESAHNYNCAIDTFLLGSGLDMYSEGWYRKYLEPELPYFLNWYGTKGSKFPELPHIEFREWKRLVVEGKAQLVEPIPKVVLG